MKHADVTIGGRYQLGSSAGALVEVVSRTVNYDRNQRRQRTFRIRYITGQYAGSELDVLPRRLFPRRERVEASKPKPTASNPFPAHAAALSAMHAETEPPPPASAPLPNGMPTIVGPPHAPPAILGSDLAGIRFTPTELARSECPEHGDLCADAWCKTRSTANAALAGQALTEFATRLGLALGTERREREEADAYRARLLRLAGKLRDLARAAEESDPDRKTWPWTGAS